MINMFPDSEEQRQHAYEKLHACAYPQQSNQALQFLRGYLDIVHLPVVFREM
jgi:hypothetical protein